MKKCYIVPVENCSCDCTFCISKSRDYKNKIEGNEDNSFLRTPEDILTTLRLRGIKSFEITGGGEPFLDKELKQKVSLIRRIIPDAYIKIYTNGNHLQVIDGIDEVNISVAHYDDEKNKRIMKPNVYVPLLDKIRFFKNNYPQAKIRLSIPLLKDGINSNEEVKKLIEATSLFDIEYVIRTIYPHTPNYEKQYINVDYFHPKIKYERDNGVNEFEEIIWWANNELYADWSLKRHKHLFSYLVLKPDAQKSLDEILNLIEEKQIDYCTRLYKNINEIIYLYRDKPENYQRIIKVHLKSLEALFGSEFLVLFITKLHDPQTLEELIETATRLKHEIRNTYSFTHNHNGRIALDGFNVEANMVHAPDSSGIKFDEDVDFLNGLTFQPIDKDTLTLARKHRSFKL